MAWDGNGSYTRSNGTQTGATTWAQADSAGNNITTSQHDTHDEDLATAINACLTKNNETKPTADFKPNADNSYSLGSSVLRWVSLCVSTSVKWIQSSYTGTMQAATMTAARTWRLPDADVDFGTPTVGAQGRLTLTTAVPITTSDVTGATTVYFTPHKGNKVEIYDGTSWPQYTFTELSQATTDSTKSPAAVATSSNYDVFVWNDSGTLRATRGPAWSSATARGTGAGTTELELFEGRYVNKIAITNGPAARRGLYVGTIRSDGSSQINDSLTLRHVWNHYNRASRPMRAVDTTNSWTYSTAAYRQANNSAANQLDFVIGLSDDTVRARAIGQAENDSGNQNAATGIGLDSATVNSAGIRNFNQTVVAARTGPSEAEYIGFPGIGRHYLAWLEYATASGTTTWYGDGGTTYAQTGIQGEIRA